MLESDADRLASIQALGGALHHVNGREVWSIFDDSPLEVMTSPGVEGRSTTLTCRSSDIPEAQKEQPIEVGSDPYRVKRVERNSPSLGWTTLHLKR